MKERGDGLEGKFAVNKWGGGEEAYILRTDPEVSE